MTNSSKDWHQPMVGVLVVCTANICRSPAAAHLLRDVAGPDLTVTSAGTNAFHGAAACREASRLLEEMGHAVAGSHLAQPLTEPMIRGASLILTASREHRAAVVELVPNAQRRTFTLPQAARLAAWLAEGGTRRPSGSASERAVWLADELDGARGDAERPPSPSDDDLPDPHVGLADTHEDVIERIAGNVAALGLWLAPADHEMTAADQT